MWYMYQNSATFFSSSISQCTFCLNLTYPTFPLETVLLLKQFPSCSLLWLTESQSKRSCSLSAPCPSPTPWFGWPHPGWSTTGLSLFLKPPVYPCVLLWLLLLLLEWKTWKYPYFDQSNHRAGLLEVEILLHVQHFLPNSLDKVIMASNVWSDHCKLFPVVSVNKV